jgi:hypothetical protein
LPFQSDIDLVVTGCPVPPTKAIYWLSSRIKREGVATRTLPLVHAKVGWEEGGGKEEEEEGGGGGRRERRKEGGGGAPCLLLRQFIGSPRGSEGGCCYPDLAFGTRKGVLGGGRKGRRRRREKDGKEEGEEGCPVPPTKAIYWLSSRIKREGRREQGRGGGGRKWEGREGREGRGEVGKGREKGQGEGKGRAEH